MRYYDPNWQLRYNQWIGSQAAYGNNLKPKSSRVSYYDRNSKYMRNLLKNGFYNAYNSLSSRGNSLWKQYGYGLYGNAGLGKYQALKNFHKRSTRNTRSARNKRSYGRNILAHGAPGFYGLGLNALTNIASGGPYGFYPYYGGRGGYGGYGGGYGHGGRRYRGRGYRAPHQGSYRHKRSTNERKKRLLAMEAMAVTGLGHMAISLGLGQCFTIRTLTTQPITW